MDLKLKTEMIEGTCDLREALTDKGIKLSDLSRYRLLRIGTVTVFGMELINAVQSIDCIACNWT